MPTRWWSSPTPRFTLAAGLIFGLQACSSCGLDEDIRLRCAVEMGGPAPSSLVAVDPTLGALVEAGPHSVWSTQPDPSCPHNPIMAAASSDAQLELMVTYPAAQDPLVSGFGDVAPGDWPVILFGHATSYQQCRTLDAYPSLHRHWASWGYIVVSVDASPLCVKNSQSNLEGRRDDLIAAWDTIKSLNQDPKSPFFERVDEERLILAGHSRGASGALLASPRMPQADGLIWLQGVDTAGYHLGHPEVRIPALGIIAGSDQDIQFPKGEPTENQLVAEHSWVRLVGGIHSFTSDTIPQDDDENPGLTRTQQIDSTAHLSTLLLAATSGVSDGLRPIQLPAAATLLFGPDVLELYPAIQATWERPSAHVLWIADFQQESETNLTGGVFEAHPSEAAQTRLAWTSGTGGRILGDASALQLQAGTTRFGLGEAGQTLPAGSLLVFRLKNHTSGELSIHVDGEDGRISHRMPDPPANGDVQYYRQIEIVLNETESYATDLTLEMTSGEAMIDDIRLIFP